MTNTFPRPCEMGNGMIRMDYLHVDRAHDAAIVEQELRDGSIIEIDAAALFARIEAHRYSEGEFVR